MNKGEDLKSKTISSFFWQLSQKIIGQLISFIISVILARLLLPEDYGVIALCGMFMILFSLFIGGGLNVALIQKKDVDDLDLNTIFYASFVFSIIMCVIIFAISPLVAVAFQNPLATQVLRIMSIGMIIGSFGNIPSVFISRQLEFRKLFFPSLTGQVLSGIVGVTMAYMGYGVWALVAQNLVSTITSTLFLLIIVKWKPQFTFSWQRFKGMYSFTWKQIVATGTATISEQLRGYVIGIKYSPADLAYYNRGDGLPGLVYNQINSTINTVLFPALSQLQDNKDAIKNALSRSMKVSSYILMPALLGLAAISDKLVVILYTEKWLPAVPYMQLVCVIYCFSLIGGANTQALTAMGRSDIVMKWEFMKRPVMLTVLLITSFISPIAIAIGQCIFAICVCFFNAYPNKKVLGYPIREQVTDVGGNLILSLTMAILVYFMGIIHINIYVCLIIQIIIGLIVYLSISVICKNDSFFYLKNYVYEHFILKKFEQ